MTPAQLIDRCTASGVQLWRVGSDGIGYEIPADLPPTVVERLLSALATAKPRVLPLLAPPSPPVETIRQRSTRASERERGHARAMIALMAACGDPLSRLAVVAREYGLDLDAELATVQTTTEVR